MRGSAIRATSALSLRSICDTCVNAHQVFFILFPNGDGFTSLSCSIDFPTSFLLFKLSEFARYVSELTEVEVEREPLLLLSWLCWHHSTATVVAESSPTEVEDVFDLFYFLV